MKENVAALMSAIIFGFGLCLSEMINPAVVIGFLDVTGNWNPALLFVMAGALLVTFVSFRFILRCDKPVCSQGFNLPQKTSLDAPLIIGALIFGVGWGLAGICPGPAIASLGLHVPKALVFALSMFVGMGIFQLFNK